jgi:hypothetical protein
MLPFFLYLLTGLITGFHLYTLLALVVYGAPFNLLEVLAFLGSIALIIAAYLSLFRSYLAARVALIATLLIWSFYGPALAKLAREKSGHVVPIAPPTSILAYVHPQPWSSKK